jgi:putative zinc finger/helix-turn-helix YgiT family protein
MICPNCGNPELTSRTGPYKYDESGLPNVTLQGIKVLCCATCGEEMPVIPAISDLHRVLSLVLVNKPQKLSPAEFRFLRKYLGYSATDFARVIDASREHLSRWENGTKPISSFVDRLMRLMVVAAKRVDNYDVDRLAEIGSEAAADGAVFISRSGEGWSPSRAA